MGTSRSSIIAFGLPRSGSTWAFNVVSELLRPRAPDVSSFFASSIADVPASALLSMGWLLIKTHNCERFDKALISNSFCLATIRDPRDCVASVMEMFGVSFPDALAGVSAGADSVLRDLDDEALILKYEDGDIGSGDAIERIAMLLGFMIDPQETQSLAQSLSTGAVAQTIRDLQEAGVIGSNAMPETFDPATHWHPHHIGDGRIGKFAAALTEAQAAEVIDRNRDFMRTYYLDQIAPPIDLPASLEFGTQKNGNIYCDFGFSVPEPGGIWTSNLHSRISIPLSAPLGEKLSLRFLLSPASAFLESTTTELGIAVNGALSVQRTYRGPSDHFVCIDLAIRDAQLTDSNMLEVDFLFEDIRSPAEVGLSSDARKLGVLLTSIQVFGERPRTTVRPPSALDAPPLDLDQAAD